jgi:HAD superfamily hydrolase (TIGR01509 family)
LHGGGGYATKGNLLHKKEKIVSKNKEYGVLFDCDGVLVNSEEITFEEIYALVIDHGFVYSRREYALLSIGGSSFADLFNRLASDFEALHGRPLHEDFSTLMIARYQHAVTTKLAAVPEVEGLLQTLKREKIACAVGTNADTAGTHWKLKSTNLRDYFNGHIYSREMVEHPKPAPDVYLMGAMRIKRDPKKCFVIEDSIPGATAGVAAGATVIGYTGGTHRDSAYAADLNAVGVAFTTDSMAEAGKFILRTIKAAP